MSMNNPLAQQSAPQAVQNLYQQIWSYVNVQRAPVAGPQPRLARGTGHTGDPSLPGNAPQLPGYLAQQDYRPEGLDYQPKLEERNQKILPRTINVGLDGITVLGTYRAHDFTPADRWQSIARSVPNWQIMEYPVDFRNILTWQQVQKYRIFSNTLQARPLPQSNYFLGYIADPLVAQDLGGTTGLGSMGSM